MICGTLACGDGASPTGSPTSTPDPTYSVQGTWTFGEFASGSGLRSMHYGSAALTQAGTAFDGTYSFWWAASGATGVGTGSGPVSSGSVVGAAVVFSTGDCTYSGTFSAAGESMSGEMTCPSSGTDGTWIAVRH